MTRVRVLVGDDHALVLEGIRSLLEFQYDVVGTADNGQALVEQALRLRPDMVVLDVAMPVLNGIEAATTIRKILSATKVIFISMHSNAIYVRKAVEAGASAYVLKSAASEELLKALETVRRGATYFSPGLGQDILNEVAAWPQKATQIVIELTNRQRQILMLVADGKQNKEIASLLNLSVKTVEFHRSRIMTKVGTHSIAELTRFAIREGLIISTD